MAQYVVNNNSVENLLGWIKSDEIAIPEIQRPFVWDSSKVRDLIDSLYNGYPVGYIITWKNPDVKLKDGTISIGKKVLIDGQQRITALTAAIAGQMVINENYKRVRIKISFNPITEKFEVYNPALGKNTEWIPDISEIFQPTFDSFQFVSNYANVNNIAGNKINQTIQKLLSIRTNSIGVIDLSPELNIETVTEIFIRINSKGVVLSQADFAMSKISSNDEYGGGIIRKTIDYFCHLKQRPMDIEQIQENDSEFCNQEAFNKIKWIIKETDDIYVPSYSDVLRVAFTSKFARGKLSDLVSLLSGRSFETREYLDEITKDSFQKLYEGVQDFVNQTNYQRYLMIVKSVGIIDKSLIRSQNVLNFGYILYLVLKNKGVNSNIIEKSVRKWLILTILTGRYSGSPESVFDYDIKRFNLHDNPLDFIENEEKGNLSDAYWENILVTRLDTSVASSPFFNLYLMAQIKEGNKGFLSANIKVEDMIEQRGDVHHLFPKKYLQKNGYDVRGIYNQIANYVYAQSEINVKIKDKSPKEYMSTVLQQMQEGKTDICSITDSQELQHNFAQNCIPSRFTEYTVENYEEFLKERRILMAKKIEAYYKSL
ncbi:hypothetical protein HNQ43_001396 [Faecalicoccus acidiformans]|uniref:GmrSD restriction endonucleases N-terminal domain-containing protein n=1 Tax=Faecalicoccus acidiformans TaxID=915173 RepID=A0A7W8D3D9_9FIRM|nr:DUF262 domain-containing protein [Faecalicoccus acidiformans]MBB5185342.1 hypothetical protein [Faecalicoccus acidiformans]